jgi:hypothetical protein
MTAPAVQSITEEQFTTAASSFAVDMPATVVAGELLILIINIAAPSEADVTEATSEWTHLGATRDKGSGHVYGRVVTGDETDPVVINTNGTDSAASQIWRISGWSGQLADITLTGISNQNGGMYAAGQLYGAYGSADYLYLHGMHSGDDDIANSGYSTGYSNGTDTISGAGTDAGCTVAMCSKGTTASTNDDPDEMHVGSTQQNAPFLLAIPPAGVDRGTGRADYASITETNQSAEVTTHAASMPATVEAGDLLLWLASIRSESPEATPTGWTQLALFVNVDVDMALYAKDAAGTEGGGTASFTTAVAKRSVHLVMRIQSGNWKGTLADDVDISASENTVGNNFANGMQGVTAGGGAAANKLYIVSAWGNSDDNEHPPLGFGADRVEITSGTGSAAASASIGGMRWPLATWTPQSTERIFYDQRVEATMYSLIIAPGEGVAEGGGGLPSGPIRIGALGLSL